MTGKGNRVKTGPDTALQPNTRDGGYAEDETLADCPSCDLGGGERR
jgi:hypothetical protein